jgi:hypothetical protein
MKRKGRSVEITFKLFIEYYHRLQSIPTPQLPTTIRTRLNNIRNFITRSTNNINTVRFRNARSNTPSNMSTMVGNKENRILFKEFYFVAITTSIC